MSTQKLEKTESIRQELQGNAPARRFIKEAELAEITGIKIGTWQKKRGSGTGPKFYKIMGAVRYDLIEVLAWIDSQAQTCGPAQRLRNSE
jgi:predicted DNA-binding transcriptional regulator AlpA